MLRSMNDLLGFMVTTSDGDIAGRIEQFYFDDGRWAVRYLVVEPGGWMAKRRVLVSPAAVGELNWMVRVLKLALTKEEIENGPDVETDKPVSRQREEEVLEYFRWPRYWTGPHLWGAKTHPAPQAISPPPGGYPDRAGLSEPQQGEDAGAARERRGDPHLRSSKAVTGYDIEATDGRVGRVEDFLVEEGSWAIRYVVVDTKNWWPGKEVLVSSRWIESVRWAQSKVYVDLTREAIKSAPDYSPEMRLSRDYEARLHRHYRRTPYWLQGRGGAGGRRAKASARAQAPQAAARGGAADRRSNKG